MTRFPPRVRLAGVAVGEVRIKRIGPSPVDMSKIAIVDDQMNPVSAAIFSAFSNKTRKLIDQLCTSIEEDFVSALEAQDELVEEGEVGEDEGIELG